MLNFPPPHLSLFPASRLVATSMAHRAMRHPDSPHSSGEGFFGGMVSLHPSSLAFFMGFHGFSCKGLVCIDLSIRTVERISFSCGASKPNGTFYTFHAVNAAQRHVQRNSPKVAGNMTDPPLVVFWCYNDPNFGNLQSFKPP